MMEQVDFRATKPMSQLEQEELEGRIKCLGEDQQKIVAGALPDIVIWNELWRRFDDRTQFMNKVKGLT